jgi:hypothetical protein
MLDRKTNCNMWVRTWSEILNDSRARLQLFERELNYTADKDDCLAFLRATYARIFSLDPALEVEKRPGEFASANSTQIHAPIEYDSERGSSENGELAAPRD